MKKLSILGIVMIALAVVVLMSTFLPNWLLYSIFALAGVPVGIIVFLAASPLLKEQLLHDPSNPDKLGMFIEVGTGRSVGIDFGGNFAYQIDDDMTDPVLSQEEEKFFNGLSGLWMLYKRYVWRVVHVHVYIPFFMKPKTYDLPRYEVVPEGGKRVYKVIDDENPRYISNHVRTTPFPWYFNYGGADIQTVPYTVQGAAQVMIEKSKVKQALYHTESWNILLDQVLNSVIQAVVRSKLTIDMVIGSVSKDIWEDTTPDRNAPEMVATLIYKGVTEYKFSADIAGGEFAGKSLKDLGIVVLSVDVTDFKDELTDEERAKLRAAVLGRQAGRARDLEGQGIAKEQERMAAVLKELDPRLYEAILNSRAWPDAVSKGGSAESLMTALAKHFMK